MLICGEIYDERFGFAAAEPDYYAPFWVPAGCEENLADDHETTKEVKNAIN